MPRPLLPLLLLVLGCAPRTQPSIPADDRVVVALESAPIQLDPRMGTDQASGRVWELLLDGLVAKDTDGALVPALAERWEILDGGRRYRFHLRPGVRFHDGRTLSAHDVVWSFQPMLDGTVPSSKAGAFPSLDRVEAVDEQTVDFRLSEPFGALLVSLTTFQGILPDGLSPEEMNRHPVGTGPFRFLSRTPDRVELARNESYWRGAPRLARVVLREVPDGTVRALELRKGSVHLVVNALEPDLVPGFRSDPAFRVVETPGANYAYLGMRLDDPVLRDVRVRRALALAIDRQRLVDTLWRGLGVVTETLIPPGHWARNDELPLIPYDPGRAARLLDEAGYPDPDGPGGRPRVTLTLKTSNSASFRLQAQVIQAMLAEVGVAIEVRSFEFATFYRDIRQGAFQLYTLVWTGIADPDFYRYALHSEKVPPIGANRGRYSNPRFDLLLDQGARFGDPAARRPFYLEAQEILAHDLPYISLFTRKNVAVMPTALVGYQSYPSGELYALREMAWRRPTPGS